MNDWAVVIRLSSMGDIVLTTGVLEHWRETRGLRVVVLTRDRFAPLFRGHPAVIDAIPIAPAQVTGVAWAKTARRLAKEYQGRLLVDLHGSLRSRALALLWSGPVVRYPAFRRERQRFLRDRSPAAGQSLRSANIPQRYAMALDRPPPAGDTLRPRVYLSSAEMDAARSLLQSHGLGDRVIAVHPYATHPLKTWQEREWRELAQSLDVRGLQWIVLGKSPLPLFDTPESDRDFTNRTDLRMTAALLACATVLVTADSGPMHLAEAVGTPVIALFGPTTREWGFYPGGPRDIVMELPMTCRPCSLHGRVRSACGQECLRAITTESVLAQLEPFG